MLLSPLLGNPQAKTAIEKMVSAGSVPSTLLFHGPDGVGKKQFALGLAELLMGPKSTLKLLARTHPDLHILSPKGKSGMHPIENIRKLIDEAALPPYEAAAKVFILEDAHQMLPTSSNALLKVLEEPFSHSYFILLAPSLDALLPTLVSRCRKIPFFCLSQEEIEQVVQREWKKTEKEARRIAFLSHGSLAKAFQIKEQNATKGKELLQTFLSLHLPRDYPQLVKVSADLEAVFDPDEKEEAETDTFNSVDALFEEIVMWYRDLHLLKEGVATEHLYHLDHLEALKLALHHPLPPLEIVLEQMALARLASQRHIRLRTVLEHFFLNINSQR